MCHHTTAVRRDERIYWATKYPVREAAVHAFARKTLKALPKKSLKILDLGCGYGDDALFFARHGHAVVALDFSDASMKKLKERIGQLSIKPVRRDLSKRLPFKDCEFDVVYAHLSVHYFDDAVTQKIFDDVRRVLRKGGLFFVKCKSVDDPLYGKGKKVGPDTFRREHLRHFFSKEYMKEKLQVFEIVDLRRSSSTYDGVRSAFIEAIAQS